VKRWTKEEDALLLSMYSAGVLYKHMAREFGRSKSAVCNRLKILRHRGAILERRLRMAELIEIKVRMSPELYSRLQSRAAAKNLMTNVFIRQVLDRYG
jgi:hypothetical protein